MRMIMQLKCPHCGEELEELHVVSRLVGKDSEDINRLIDEEDELVDVKKVTLKK